LLYCNSGVDRSWYLTLLTCSAWEQTETASAGHVIQWTEKITINQPAFLILYYLPQGIIFIK